MNTLSQNEWDFSDKRIEKSELPWCFRYEYARNSNSFLEYTDQWRKEHKGATKHFNAAVGTLKRFAVSGLLDTFTSIAELFEVSFPLQRLPPKSESEILERPELKVLGQAFDTGFLEVLPHLTKMYHAAFGKTEKGSRMLHASCQMDFDFFMLLDERFPGHAYLDSDFTFRRLKFFLLNQFFSPELDSKLDADSRMAINARAFWQTSHLHAQFDSQNADSRTELQGQFALQYFVAGVNWARSNDVIKAEFERWLIQTRPCPHYDRARKTNERDLLKPLGALRLRRVMSWEEAQRHTKGVLGYPLYSGEKSWKRAVAKADAKTKEPFVPFTGLLAHGAK